MKFSEGRVGRVFLVRLEHGDIIPDCIERFKEKHQWLMEA
jgi:predicted DNA-binding protein with PD1-like motif